MKGQLRMLLYPDYKKIANYPSLIVTNYFVWGVCVCECAYACMYVEVRGQCLPLFNLSYISGQGISLNLKLVVPARLSVIKS